MADEILPCWVYRSPRKQEMYLYLASEDDFGCVPPALLTRFGEPVLVIELELSPERRLAREDVRKVMQNLREHGFHLQMPPELNPQLYEGNPV
ncbi:MAG: YcgL domain-containing protein [Chromatiaceae bacterium]|nr:YcgL domain-containing protein [Gammaproteobacteria bacterium]MCP5300387.1 YcgL domain-containing protein [Chromatiaceae bacterium]MCP5422459.1 YcgL domain-containing protein [Chromatiaceae bacterium]